MHKHNLNIKLPFSWAEQLKNTKIEGDIYSPLEQIYSDINQGHDVYPL